MNYSNYDQDRQRNRVAGNDRGYQLGVGCFSLPLNREILKPGGRGHAECCLFQAPKGYLTALDFMQFVSYSAR